MISESFSTLVWGGVLRVIINSFIRPVTETERNSIKLKKNSNKDNLTGNQLQWIIRGAPADGYNKAYHLPFLTSGGSTPWAKGRGGALLYRLPCWLFFLMQFFFFLPKISGRDPPLLTLPPPPLPSHSVLSTPLLFFSFCVLLSAEVLITFFYIFSTDVRLRYLGSNVAMPSGPKRISSTMSRHFHAFSGLNISGA